MNSINCASDSSNVMAVSEQAGLTEEFSSDHPYKRIEFFAEQTPNATAIEFLGTQYSYAWLNSRANRLARLLQAREIAMGDRVAVCVEPSPFILVAILALHKLGVTYVPLDPEFPAARLQSMLEDAKPKALLFACSKTSLRQALSCETVIELDQFEQLTEDLEDKNLDIEFGVDAESHIFFTSGTTGKPKGVLASHSNLIHYLSSAQSIYRFNCNDIFISAARYTFSISLFELLLPLFAGARVHLVPRDDVLNLAQMAKHFETATVFHIGPSLLKKVLPFIEANYDNFDAFAKMRHVSSGGDHVPPGVLEQLKRIFTNAEVYVIYGSTEVSCMGCTYFVPRDKAVTQTYVGAPHRNTIFRVEDDDGHLVGEGEVGNVLFSGPGVVKGYLNLPELTEEKFVLRDGRRFYKIGDMGKVSEEGLLSLSGRKDFQVQFHGMRIELLEIENTLKKIDSIVDCVVAGVKDDDKEEIALVAYIVAQDLAQVNPQALSEYLSQFLPDYSIPSKYVGLTALPLNHNGKLDRSQLPKPTIENMLVSAQYTDATNETEKALVEMWEGLFGLSGIGTNHSFFELGGDSLMAVQFLTEVDNRFNKFIPITSLINHPSIQSIAAIIDGTVDVPEMQNVNVLRNGDTTIPPLFCLYGVLLYQDLANALDVPNLVCGVYLQEEIDLINKGMDSEEFKAFTDVYKIAEKYVQSIQQYQQHGPYYLSGESFGGIIALEVAKLLEAKGEEVKLIAMFDAIAPGFIERFGRIDKLRTHIRLMYKSGLAHVFENMTQRIQKYTRKIKAKFSPVASGSTAVSQKEEKDIREFARGIASSTYHPKKSAHNIVLFRATERSPFEPPEEDLGWGRCVEQVKVVNVEGDHLSILEKPNVDVIACELQKSLVINN